MSHKNAIDYLTSARKQWTKEHTNIVAKPLKDGKSFNLMEWKCVIPGKNGTDWKDGKYPMRMIFDENYPTKPPKCWFEANFFHPNVFPSGLICMSLLDEDKEWKPDTTFKEILEGIQNLLSWPDPTAPVQDAYDLYISNQEAYRARVREQAASYTSSASS